MRGVIRSVVAGLAVACSPATAKELQTRDAEMTCAEYNRIVDADEINRLASVGVGFANGYNTALYYNDHVTFDLNRLTAEWLTSSTKARCKKEPDIKLEYAWKTSMYELGMPDHRPVRQK